MKPHQLSALVAEAVSLDRQIAEDEKRLKELKALLIQEAESLPVTKDNTTEAGGSSHTFEGNDGCIARIVFPGDKLKGEIDLTTKDGAKMLDIVRFHEEVRMKVDADIYFDQLFQAKLVYVPRESFRETVKKLFPPVDGQRIIKLCTGKSTPQVHFETKEAV